MFSECCRFNKIFRTDGLALKSSAFFRGMDIGGSMMCFVYRPGKWEGGHEGADVTGSRHHVITRRRKR